MRVIKRPDGRTVTLRHAEEDDAGAALAHFIRVGAETDFLSFGAEGPGHSEEQERERIARARRDENALFLLAEMDGEIVGSLTFEGGPRKRIRHIGEFGIVVAKACQGMGVGRALLEEMIEWAEATGIVRKINLRVCVENTHAIALYERMGFVTEGRIARDLYFDGAFRDALLMGRSIDPPLASPSGNA